MTLFSKTELATLVDNGKAENHGKDHVPVARFFLNGVNGTLLVTEILPGEKGLTYGLYSLANDCKTTQFSIDGLAETMQRHGFELKRDARFKGQYPLSVYDKAAKRRIAVADLQYTLKKTAIFG